MKLIETIRTARHVFYLVANRYQEGTFEVEFRPLNPKTNEPWQASHLVTRGADMNPAGWDRPFVYSTLELARTALAWKMAELD